MKKNKYRPIMTLTETDTAFNATINDISVSIDKSTKTIINGVKQHPRLMAIEQAAKLANVNDWILFNT